MDSFWQNLAVIPAVAGAVIYMLRQLSPRKRNESTCSGCAPDGKCGECPLVGENRQTSQEPGSPVKL